MTLKEIAPKVNLDLERTFALFMGKEDMYVKYLKKYPENAKRLMEELKEAVAQNDYKGIESSAHGLKGVSANLGLQAVTEISAALVMDIRKNTYEKIIDDYHMLVEETDMAINCIEQLE